MKKILLILAAALLVCPHLFAYWVVLKDGSKYDAVDKPVITGNRVTIKLKSGQTIVLAADAIDLAKSEEVTRLGGGQLLGVEQRVTPTGKPASSLGSQIKLRRPEQQQTAPVAAAPAAPTGPTLGAEVLDKFERAYENVGIFEHKITSTGPHELRADLTVDNEDKVFNTISATAFLIIKNAGLPNVTIGEVDLFMKMTNGGTAGRFKMTRDDANALYLGGNAPDRTKLQQYFVSRVLF